MQDVRTPQLGVGQLPGPALSSVCQHVFEAERGSALLEGRDYRIDLQVLLSALTACSPIFRAIQRAS